MLQVFQLDLGKHIKSACFFSYIYPNTYLQFMEGDSGEEVKHEASQAVIKLLQENKCNNFRNTENMR